MAPEKQNRDCEEDIHNLDDMTHSQLRNGRPQLYAGICGHNWGCECGQDIGEGGDGGGGYQHTALDFAGHEYEAYDEDASTCADERSVDGDEGIPEHAAGSGGRWMDYGFHIDPARYSDLRCRIGILPDVFELPTPYNSHFPSGMHTPSSMHPEHDSAESSCSMVSSMMLSPPFMSSSTILASVGEHLMVYHFTAEPLPLVPVYRLPVAVELLIAQASHSDFPDAHI